MTKAGKALERMICCRGCGVPLQTHDPNNVGPTLSWVFLGLEAVVNHRSLTLFHDYSAWDVFRICMLHACFFLPSPNLLPVWNGSHLAPELSLVSIRPWAQRLRHRYIQDISASPSTWRKDRKSFIDPSRR